jgi:integrase
VRICASHTGKYKQFTLTWYVADKRIKRTFSDEKKAIAHAHEVVKKLALGREEMTKVPLHEWEELLECKRLLDPVPVRAAVEFYLQHHPRNSAHTVVKDIVAEYIASREKAQAVSGRGGSERWIETLRFLLGKFATGFPKGIGSITASELEAFLTDPDQPWSPRTRYNLQQAIRTLFKFAQRKAYLPKGETAADRMERIEKPVDDPEVVKPEDFKRVLTLVHSERPDLVPYLVIGAFAGVRSAEICRLEWEKQIDLEEGVIRLPSEITKTKRRRTVEMNAPLRAWLRTVKDRSGRVVPYSNVHRSLAPFVNRAKAKWPHNGLRHSFASYDLALHRNAHATAETCGHSVAMLQTNYKQLVTRKEAQEWFSILPPGVIRDSASPTSFETPRATNAEELKAADSPIAKTSPCPTNPPQTVAA